MSDKRVQNNLTLGFTGLVVLAHLGTGVAMPSVWQWPGPAPCNTTLQACIDSAAAGDVVEIASNGPIDESLNLSASLSLRPATGYKPTFAIGRAVLGASNQASFVVSVSGLSLDDGYVDLYYGGSGSASLSVQRMAISQPSGSSAGIILNATASASEVEFGVEENQIDARVLGWDGGAILIRTSAATAHATVSFNRVTSLSSPSGNGILLEGLSGTTQGWVYANEVRGSFGGSAIRVSDRGTATMAVNVTNNVAVGSGSGLSDGISFLVFNGAMTSQVVNNTVTRQHYGIYCSYWIGGVGSNTIALVNNLVAFNSYQGIYISPGYLPSSSADYNLVFGNQGNTYTQGPNDVTADPLLFSSEYPRPKSGSPAIDGGDTSTAWANATELGLEGLPMTDGDGLQRFHEGVDIGAYESGADALLSGRAPGGDHLLPLDHASLNSKSYVISLVTSNWNPEGIGGVYNDHAVGLSYESSVWSVYNEDAQPMLPGAAFNLFVGYGQGMSVHTADAGNTSGASTVVTEIASGMPDLIVHASNCLNAGGTPDVVNDHNIAVTYSDPSWYIVNQDGAAIPPGADFNIYVQEPSPNVFHHQTHSSNIVSNWTILDHPLLNGTPCAQVTVTATTLGAANDHAIGVWYNGLRWCIYNQDRVNMPAGVIFNVLVDPAQVLDCRLVIFSDSFEHGDTAAWSATVP